MLQTNSIVTSFTLNDMEDIAFWTDNRIIYSSPINKSINTKVIIYYNISLLLLIKFINILNMVTFY